MERLTRLLLAGLVGMLAMLAVLANMETAGAHAVLTSSTPSADEIVPTLPTEIVMSFDEDVQLAAAGVHVVRPNGSTIGDRCRALRRVVRCRLDADNGTKAPNVRGTWTVSWAVVSADGHPVAGAFVFHVGAPGGGVHASTGESNARDVVGRWTTAAGRSLIVVACAVLFGAAMWAAVGERTRRRAAAVLLAGAALFVGGQVVSATSIGGGVGPAVSAWARTPTGAVSLAVVVLAGFGALMAVRRRGSLPVWWVIGLVAVSSLAGHGLVVAPRVLSVAASVVHAVAAAVWIGGLLMLLARADAAHSPSAMGTDATVSRIVRVMPWAAALVAVSGGVLVAARTPWPSGFSTTYARLAVAKSALLVAALALAAITRWRALDVSGPQGARRFRRLVAAESLAVCAALVLGGLASTTPPPRAALAAAADAGRSQSFTRSFGPYVVRVEVEGEPVARVSVRVSDPTTHLPPADLTQLKVGVTNANTALAPVESVAPDPTSGRLDTRLTLVNPGPWKLIVDARRGRFEFLRATIAVR